MATKKNHYRRRRRRRRRKMKIQCDVCEKAPASVICCADEAALCSRCDEQVHAANKLASKHQRLLLIHCNDATLSNSSPPPSCDICREKPAFIFCVEDRALFCQGCDEPIHSSTKLAATHQRFLLTGIRVAAAASPLPKPGSPCNNNNNPHPKHNHDPDPIRPTTQTHVQSPPNFNSPPWGAIEDDFLHFSDFQSSSFHKKENMEFGEFEWEMSLFGGGGGGGDYHQQVPQEPAAAAMVPQLRPNKPTKSNKKPRIDISNVNVQDDDDHEFFKVPDLGC